MGKEKTLPTESEWKIMEALWNSQTPLTSMEIKEKMQGENTMTLKMVRVLTNRLLQKGLIDFEVDKKDSRVYHYHAVKTKEECVKEKSRHFIESYFSGNHANAFAALLGSCTFTKEQIKELEEILEQNQLS